MISYALIPVYEVVLIVCLKCADDFGMAST